MFIVLPLDDGSNGPINPPTYPPLYLGSSRPRWFNIIEIIHWTATGSKCKCILSKSQFISINSKIIIVINRNRRRRRHRGCCQAKAVCCDPVNERSFDHRTVMHFAIMYTRNYTMFCDDRWLWMMGFTGGGLNHRDRTNAPFTKS